MAKKKILIVLGSVRQGRAADKVCAEVKKAVERVGAQPEVMDFKEHPLPFYDQPMTPSSAEYDVSQTPAADWAKKIASSDAVLFLEPEYNHSLSPVLKNAIDWVYQEWKEKPVGVVYYGAYGGEHVIDKLTDLLTFFKMKIADDPARLWLGKDLEWDGSVKDSAVVTERLDAAVKALVAIA